MTSDSLKGPVRDELPEALVSVVDEEFGEGDRFLNDDRAKLLDKELIKWLKDIL